MIQVERRRGVDLGNRAQVWTRWRRLEQTKPLAARLCGAALAAMIFGGTGILVGWLLSQTVWPWVSWDGIDVAHRIKPDGNSELVMDVGYEVTGKCDRLRLTAPWSLVAYYPDRNVSVALPVTPSDELIARAGKGRGRVILSLGSRLAPGIRHEISLGLVCLQDNDGGTVHDADPSVVVKEFTP